MSFRSLYIWYLRFKWNINRYSPMLIYLKREVFSLQFPWILQNQAVISHTLTPKDENHLSQRDLKNSPRQKSIANAVEAWNPRKIRVREKGEWTEGGGDKYKVVHFSPSQASPKPQYWLLILLGYSKEEDKGLKYVPSPFSYWLNINSRPMNSYTLPCNCTLLNHWDISKHLLHLGPGVEGRVRAAQS